VSRLLNVIMSASLPAAFISSYTCVGAANNGSVRRFQLALIRVQTLPAMWVGPFREVPAPMRCCVVVEYFCAPAAPYLGGRPSRMLISKPAHEEGPVARSC